MSMHPLAHTKHVIFRKKYNGMRDREGEREREFRETYCY